MTTHAPADPTLPERESTVPLMPALAELGVDPIAALDRRTRSRLRPEGLAARGPHLAFRGAEGRMLLALEPNLTHIGRSSSAAVRIEDPRVSRSHAIVVRHGRSVRVLDNRSANGTFVGERRIVAIDLRHGDVIRVGPVTMQYVEVV